MTMEATNTNTGAGVEAQGNIEGQQNQETTSLGGAQIQEGQEGQEDKKQEDQDDKQQEQEEQEKQEGQEDKQQENKELFGKPESYDYKEVKLPENMKLDETMTGKFNEYATKLNLSQKSANELMAMAVELTEQTQQQTVEAMGKLQEAKCLEYKQLLNSDKEVGGANLKESIATANLAYDAFFKDEELRTILAEGGLNVHPKFIKALKAIGSQMKNDTIHTSGNPAGDEKSREDILYPSMNDSNV